MLQRRLSIKTEICQNQRFIAGNFAKAPWQSSSGTLVGDLMPALFRAAELNPGVVNPLGFYLFLRAFFRQLV